MITPVKLSLYTPMISSLQAGSCCPNNSSLLQVVAKNTLYFSCHWSKWLWKKLLLTYFTIVAFNSRFTCAPVTITVDWTNAIILTRIRIAEIRKLTILKKEYWFFLFRALTVYSTLSGHCFEFEVEGRDKSLTTCYLNEAIQRHFPCLYLSLPFLLA